jgi:hypothetical protein
MVSVDTTPTIIVPWPLVFAKSFDFLLHEHGEVPCRQCNLDDAPCAPLAVFIWLQRLAQLCTQHHVVQPTSAIMHSWLAEQHSTEGQRHDHFTLIITASRMFGPSNMHWLLLQLDDESLISGEGHTDP